MSGPSARPRLAHSQPAKRRVLVSVTHPPIEPHGQPPGLPRDRDHLLSVASTTVRQEASAAETGQRMRTSTFSSSMVCLRRRGDESDDAFDVCRRGGAGPGERRRAGVPVDGVRVDRPGGGVTVSSRSPSAGHGRARRLPPRPSMFRATASGSQGEPVPPWRVTARRTPAGWPPTINRGGGRCTGRGWAEAGEADGLAGECRRLAVPELSMASRYSPARPGPRTGCRGRRTPAAGIPRHTRTTAGPPTPRRRWRVPWPARAGCVAGG